MKKLGISIMTAITCLLLMTVVSYSTEGGKVMSVHTGEESISLYVKGVSAEDECSAVVGTSEAKSVKAVPIEEMEIPIRTLVMIDNSISIKESDRSKIAELLQNLISDRMPGEEMAIATFSEGTTYLCQYTSEYSNLKTAIDSIEYKDQETYLTDVLYDLISTDFVSSDDTFRRIIVVSDGVDNKSLGYTKEDLNDLLKEYMVPIYSFGCTNKNKSNNDNLENMFSISRRTNADAFLLDDYENTLDMIKLLNEDRKIVMYSVVPDESVMDGSTKAVKMTIGSQTLSVECRMMQKIIEEPEVIPTVEPTVEPTKEPVKEEPVVEEEPEEGLSPMMLYIIIGGGVLLVAIIVVVVIMIVKANKAKNSFESMDDALLNRMNSAEMPPEKTEIIGGFGNGNSNDSTCMIWNNPQTYHIILTDVHSPAKTYQIPLTNTIVLGRKVGCDAVFDYEKSVSGKHCQISVRNGHFYIKDLQSANGTFINGSKVLSEVELFSGNTLKMGRLEIKFDVR